MIGQTISHYPAQQQRDAKERHKILEKLSEGGMSQNFPRTFLVSGCRFEDLAAFWREA